jgi:N-acetylmuramoyl-L-alanine amidase
MYRRWQRAAAVLLLLPGIAATKSGLNQVTGIHFWSHPEFTRIMLDATGPFEVHSERAFNPDRIFFDLRGAVPSIDGHRVASKNVDDKLLKRIRVAETAPGTTRVVLDLNTQSTFVVSRLDKPDRLVIEIRAGKPDPVSVSVKQDPPKADLANREEVARVEPPAVAPLPYVAPSKAFRYPPSSPQNRRLRSVFLASAAPSWTPAPLPPIYLPDPALQLAMLKAPKKTLIVRTDPETAASVAASTKVIPAARPLPYDATPRASENASKSLTRALGLKVNRIVIDAGHGGHDDGTIGPNGVLEKDVVLDVAIRLSKLVQTKMGAEVVLTRSDDTFIPLQQRTAIANEHKADLFLSIHANSSPAPSVAGTETFFLNFTNSPAALDVAARENAGSEKSVGELKDLIQSITLNDKITESETFAQQIQNSIFAQAAKGNAVAKNRGVKRAPFVVLIGASMPSVLAEIGFLSNARDASNLSKPEYREKIAESLLKGLQQYSQSLSHFEVAAKK